jgi:hypothetical protein
MWFRIPNTQEMVVGRYTYCLDERNDSHLDPLLVACHESLGGGGASGGNVMRAIRDFDGASTSEFSMTTIGGM